jgi:hypothetical protein
MWLRSAEPSIAPRTPNIQKVSGCIARTCSTYMKCEGGNNCT